MVNTALISSRKRATCLACRSPLKSIKKVVGLRSLESAFSSAVLVVSASTSALSFVLCVLDSPLLDFFLDLASFCSAFFLSFSDFFTAFLPSSNRAICWRIFSYFSFSLVTSSLPRSCPSPRLSDEIIPTAIISSIRRVTPLARNEP